jgi:hypothetical protein
VAEDISDHPARQQRERRKGEACKQTPDSKIIVVFFTCYCLSAFSDFFRNMMVNFWLIKLTLFLIEIGLEINQLVASVDSALGVLAAESNSVQLHKLAVGTSMRALASDAGNKVLLLQVSSQTLDLVLHHGNQKLCRFSALLRVALVSLFERKNLKPQPKQQKKKKKKQKHKPARRAHAGDSSIQQEFQATWTQVQRP